MKNLEKTRIYYKPIRIINFKINFILENLIGSGSFGKVHRVKERITGVIYAAKISFKTLNTSINIS